MFRRLLIFLLCIFVPVSAHAQSKNYGSISAEVVRIIDGDTIVVNIPTLHPLVGHHISVRLAGCNTPELRDKRPEVRALAYQAKAYVTELLSQKKITLHNIKRGKYFRIVADIYINGKRLRDILIAHGYASPM